MTVARARQTHPEPPAWARPWLASYRLALRSDAKHAPSTIYRYVDAAGWLASWLAERAPEITDWRQLAERRHRDLLRRWIAELVETYSVKYASAIAAAARAFFLWYAAEEGTADPFVAVKVPSPPPLGASPPSTIEIGQLKALFVDAESRRDFESRRDAALLRLFAATGARLAELTGLRLDDIDLDSREVTVVGKGRKTRTVRYDLRAARVLDRYIRVRAGHPAAHLDALWLGIRRHQAMTPSGVRQAIQRRARRLGLTIHPHLFRHTFADAWLAAGGAEADLIAYCGWKSTRMLQLYGAGVAGKRARTTYDKLNMFDGI